MGRPLTTRTVDMVLKGYSNVSLFSFNKKMRTNGCNKFNGLPARNYPSKKGSVLGGFDSGNVNFTSKDFLNGFYGSRVSHVNPNVELIGGVSFSRKSVLVFGNTDVSFSVNKPRDIFYLNHTCIVPQKIHGVKQMFSNENFENSVDTLPVMNGGNTEPSRSNAEGVTTMHEGRKARYSLTSRVIVRGSRNDCPPVKGSTSNRVQQQVPKLCGS